MWSFVHLFIRTQNEMVQAYLILQRHIIWHQGIVSKLGMDEF